MNGWKLTIAVTRIALPAVAFALSACAMAPAARQEMSIIESIDAQRPPGPVSCAAMNASQVCERSTRLGGVRNCQCADAHAIADGTAFSRY